MKGLRENKVSTKSGWGDDILSKVASTRNEAIIERLNDRWSRRLNDSPVIPICFEIKSADLLSRDQISVKARDEKPLSFDLSGGEKLEIARYIDTSRNIGGPSYGLAFHITEMQINGSDPQDQGKLVEHPWVKLGSILHETEVTPLEKKTLQYAEGDQIVKWLALFNPKDIDVSQINFSVDDYPKLVLLAYFGRTIAEKISTSEVTLSDLQQSLVELRQMEIASRSDESAKVKYESKLAETNTMRDFVTQNLPDDFDPATLFHEDYIHELFGEKADEWVYTIYEFLAPGDPFAWSPESWQQMITSPDTQEFLNDAELDKVTQFLTTNNLAIAITPGKMATNPFVYQKLNESIGLGQDTVE
jgi:hypothetical protein